MAEEPNKEENSQLSQLDEEDLQKLVGDGGNKACSSSVHRRPRGECNVVFVERNPLCLAIAQLI